MVGYRQIPQCFIFFRSRALSCTHKAKKVLHWNYSFHQRLCSFILQWYYLFSVLFFFGGGLIIPLKLNTTLIFPMVLEKLIFWHIFLHPGLTIPPNFFFSCRKRKVLQDSHSTGNIPQHLLTTKAECNFCVPVVFSCIVLGTYIYLTVIRIMRISPCCEYFYSFLTVYRQCNHCRSRFGTTCLNLLSGTLLWHVSLNHFGVNRNR